MGPCSVARSYNNVGNLYKPAKGDAANPTRILENTKSKSPNEPIGTRSKCMPGASSTGNGGEKSTISFGRTFLVVPPTG